jgi:hypothetical protein
MAILKNTTIQGTAHVTLPASTTSNRPKIIATVQQFTTPGTTSWTAPAGVSAIEVLVVAGGGGGGGTQETPAGGGGGGGGLIYRNNYTVTPGSAYTVTVGSGGAGGVGRAVGTNGGNSVFDTLTAIGGGGGGFYSGASAAGGSGGGAAWRGTTSIGSSGTANQGNAGGSVLQTGNLQGCAGGGGAGGPGSNSAGQSGGGGGPGLPFDISGRMTYYAAGGGGGGGFGQTPGGVGGSGGSEVGGQGGYGIATGQNGFNAVVNTGSGGGGAGGDNPTDGYTSRTGGAGASGTVIIKYELTDTGIDPKGSIRFNSDLKDLEIYESKGWIAEDPYRNYASHNMFRWSKRFDKPNWTKANCTLTPSTATLAPDGSNTGVYKLVPTLGQVGHYILQDTSQFISRRYCHSAYFKAAELTFADISPSSNFGLSNSWVIFDLINGTFQINGTNSVGTTAGMSNEGNGWWRCWIVATATNTSSGGRVGYSANASLSSDRLGGGITGNGTSGIYVYGTQIEQELYPTTLIETFSAGAPEPENLAGFRVHRFTTTGITGFVPALSGVVEVLAVGGGGSGGSGEGNPAGDSPGGGGGGGVVYRAQFPVVAGKQYQVKVGAGGGAVPGTSRFGISGEDSQFANLIAHGGGGGAREEDCGLSGGSGGGGGGSCISGRKNGGAGTPGQGFNGGQGGDNGCGRRAGAGGGGAGGPGLDELVSNGNIGGDGGPGLPFAITGQLVYYGGGGGGGNSANQGGAAGRGGAGGGGAGGTSPSGIGTAGTNGLGGGGGAAGSGTNSSGAGGSGVVIVRYRYD